jgi:HK97 family phage prohead protease
MAVKPERGTIEYRYMERSSGAPTLDNGSLSGRAAPFNTQTMIGKKPWGFREKIAPGAFSKSVNDGDVVLLDNHDTAKPIARQSAGTLKLAETKGGLDWDAIPANTTYANDVRENAKAGNYGGCSFGFEVVNDSWHYNKEDDVDERTLHEVKLHEISVVTFPAYTQGTMVSARDQVNAAKEARRRYYMREYLELYVVNGMDERAGNAPGNGKKPYGNVTYADPGYQKDGKKRYPIDTKQHCKAAWSYINKSSNASAYSSSQLASIKSKIKAACKKFGVKVNQSSADLDLDERSEKDTVVANKNASKKLKSKNNLQREIVRLCLSDDISDSTIRSHVLAAIASAKLEKAERALRAGLKAAKGNNGVGTGSDTDGDSDDATCPACSGSGMAADGVGRCAGGCSGTGFLAGQGDNKTANGTKTGANNGPSTSNPSGKVGATGDSDGPTKGSDFGLGTQPGNGNPPQPANVGIGAGDGNNPPLPGNSGPQVGTGVTGLQYSKNFDGETREDGQPDTSTDPDEDDATRYLRLVARKRRMQSESSN